MTDGAGEQFADYVKRLLEAEDAYRTSLEAKALSLITSAGALITALFAIAAFAARADRAPLQNAAGVLIAFAFGLFLVAGLLATSVLAPIRSKAVDSDELLTALRRDWDRSAEYGRKKITATQVRLLSSQQAANQLKAVLLVGAVAVELVAVALVALAVVTAI